MRKFIIISLVPVMALLVLGVYYALNQARKYFGPFENMKAGVVQTSTPLSLTAARADCPISLPDTATNIQYAVWSLWQASQTFVKFEAPVTDCLAHAQEVLHPYSQQTGAKLTSRNVAGPLAPPLLSAPKDLSVAWFDLPRFSAGLVFEMTGAGKPAGTTVWVDTNRGCFYYHQNQ